MAQVELGDSLPYVTLDVFTRERFLGNPLAIVELPGHFNLSQYHKQRIAREFNFSETVFVHPPSSGELSRTVDIFTTTEELPFAGHPIIGTLVYLGRNAAEDSEEVITLTLKAGPIEGTFSSKTGIAEATIPHNVKIHQTPVPWQTIVDAQPTLGRLKADFEDSSPPVSIVKGMTFVLVKVPRLENLTALTAGGPRIDPMALRLDEGWESFTAPYFYVIVSEDEKERQLHLRVRMIEPVCGEDPATGSAASALSAYLALQRAVPDATYNFSIDQGVEMGRHSRIGVKVCLSPDGKAVKDVILYGSAVLVSRGELYV
ncbi:MAG: hypothetical protein Q9220_004439 [cf. Caloplaca sp. 1 TL-2023]